MNKKTTHKLNRRNFIVASAVTGLGLTLNLYSCTKKADPLPDPPVEEEDNDTDPDNKINITGVSIPLNIDVQVGGDFTIEAKGFKNGDKVIIRSLTGSNNEYTVSVKSVTDDYAIIVMPEGLISDRYRLAAARGGNTFILGTTTLNVIFNANIPDQEGMTVKGVVYSGSKGIANVVVSDGFEVTKTDEDGIYYLPSNKKNGLVFVSIPGNYEVSTNGSLPLFFNKLTKPADTVEIQDFSLTPVNNDKHVLLALGDMHLANRNNDIKQFQNGFLTDVNKTIDSYKNAGNKVYALTLGDMTWDLYWYTNSYNLSTYRTQMNSIKTTVFNSVGNHDNDPYVANDWESESKYRDVLGPTYYSFNLGKVHYIVLDNTEYINTGGKVGTVGSRNYNATIVANQIEWLKKDLAMIEDKSTPIVLAMHIQLNNNPTLNGANQVSTQRLTNGLQLTNALNGFSNVQLLTGHTHMNYNVQSSTYIMEHNIAAVCATWWWTGRDGYAGNHICKDGTPGGYGVWEMENKDLKWHYKSINYEKDYQFRAYDLNKVLITKADHAPSYTGSEWTKYITEYVNVNNNNEILVNVWNYDPQWTVEITELGQPLTITRVNVLDPLHLISYNAKRLNVQAAPTAEFASNKTAHMFKAKASNPTNPVEIKVTDRFGNVYRQTMIRPKAFTYLMS